MYFLHLWSPMKPTTTLKKKMIRQNIAKVSFRKKTHVKKLKVEWMQTYLQTQNQNKGAISWAPLLNWNWICIFQSEESNLQHSMSELHSFYFNKISSQISEEKKKSMNNKQIIQIINQKAFTFLGCIQRSLPQPAKPWHFFPNSQTKFKLSTTPNNLKFE